MSDDLPLSKQEIESVWDLMESRRLFSADGPAHQTLAALFYQALQNMRSGSWYSVENQNLLKSMLESLNTLPLAEGNGFGIVNQNPENTATQSEQLISLMKKWLIHYIREQDVVFNANEPGRPTIDF